MANTTTEVATSWSNPATVMPRRLVTTATDSSPTIQRDATQAGLAEGVGQRAAHDEGVRRDDEDDGRHVGEGDGERGAVVHGPLHVEADGGRGRVETVELAEEAVGEQGEGSRHDDGDPGGVTCHIGDETRGGQVLQGGEGQAGRGGDDGAQPEGAAERGAGGVGHGVGVRYRGRPPWRWRRCA